LRAEEKPTDPPERDILEKTVYASRVWFSLNAAFWKNAILMEFKVILVNGQFDAQFFFYMFISILYMFRATPCSSSGESIASIQHLVCVPLCR
jgi:hypothetical protein